MVRLYQAYQNAVKALNPATNKQDLLTSKNLTETFFNSAELRKAFPGLSKTIQSYEIAIENSGQRTALTQLNDQLYKIANLRTKDQQRKAIQTVINSSKDQSWKELFQILLQFVPD
jgi:hypothetical protein